jgi:hypothetical protein
MTHKHAPQKYTPYSIFKNEIIYSMGVYLKAIHMQFKTIDRVHHHQFDEGNPLAQKKILGNDTQDS